jgi:hypothetical protein
MSILDRDIRPWEVAYATFVTDADEFDREVRQWYRDAHEGREPALSDCHHAYWRIIQEREWWITPRRALQDAWPLQGPTPEPGDTPPLRPRGTFFVKDGGERFTAKESTSFRLFKRFLDNEDINPVLDQLASIGFNMVRIFGVGDWGDPIYRCIPREYGQRYYDSLRPFADLLSSKGLYLEFTAFADSPRVFPGGVPEQQDHWRKVVEAFQGVPNVLLELVNENNVPVNTLDPTAFFRPSGVLSSHGSNGSQASPVEPFWDYATFHTNSAPEEQRKIGHNAWEIWGGPTLTNETSRYPEVGMWVWGAADLNRQKMLAYDSAAGSALLNAGACFHSVNGKLAFLFTPNEEAVAREWIAGMNSVPLEFQDGAYTASHLEGFPLNPDELRRYGRRLGDGRVHWVSIRK